MSLTLVHLQEAQNCCYHIISALCCVISHKGFQGRDKENINCHLLHSCCAALQILCGSLTLTNTRPIKSTSKRGGVVSHQLRQLSMIYWSYTYPEF